MERDADSTIQTQSPADSTAEPKAFGGWLIMFVISSIVGPIVWLRALGESLTGIGDISPLLDTTHSHYSIWWGPLVYGELFTNVIGFAASCWLAVMFFRRKIAFPRYWVVVSLVLTAFITADAAAVWLMSQRFPDVWTQEQITSEFRGAFGATFWLFVWGTYLHKSQRVKNTFVRP